MPSQLAFLQADRRPAQDPERAAASTVSLGFLNKVKSICPELSLTLILSQLHRELSLAADVPHVSDD